MAGRSLSRRTFLRGTGVALSLPLLDAMIPALARAKAVEAAARPRRMIAIQTNMGILPQFFFPEGTGKDYKPSEYLKVLDGYRDRMSVFSGVSHPGVDGGHAAEASFLTAAPHPGSGAFRNTVSLDQLAAEQIGPATRFPTLATRIGNERGSLSYTRGGVMIPSERSPAALYRQMFVQGTAKEIDARLTDLRTGRSVLDFVNDSAKRIEKDLGPKDKDRLDQYFTSVRDLEKNMVKSEEWEKKPKPSVAVPEPKDVDGRQMTASHKLMYDVIRLALETDSTRLVTVFINTIGNASDIAGVTHETHSLTHHGNRPETLTELKTIETMQFHALADLLKGLDATKEGEQTMLDRTMVLYGTCMGSANSHSNINLPAILVGGGFRHGGHVAFDTKKNHPLPNLYVSMLQQLGLEIDRFATSTGTMRGIEVKA
ncbi:DUF1552 domain-containing protein [Humisphaera borealis]|uniref:DUF1552 domain-containing protein n=1 Tax=Humisphaera borealis TaxID=2807512 RepID=A0A7M2WT45_9BACT|nr:DUF1552 domain-containing protein [Humisphaera borealis]QOV88589.1 DUF1552 domain-containing protein [Humisphaera borealis]